MEHIRLCRNKILKNTKNPRNVDSVQWYFVIVAKMSNTGINNLYELILYIGLN